MIQTPWRIEEHRTATGDTPVRTFLAGLPSHAKADAVALVKLAEILGNNLREPHSKPLGDGLFELRRNQVRIFYVFEPGRIVRLLGGMLKKQNRIPADVLARMREYSTDAKKRLTKPKRGDDKR
jgi:phage-related protein